MGKIIDLEPNYSYEDSYSEWADHVARMALEAAGVAESRLVVQSGQ